MIKPNTNLRRLREAQRKEEKLEAMVARMPKRIRDHIASLEEKISELEGKLDPAKRVKGESTNVHLYEITHRGAVLTPLPRNAAVVFGELQEDKYGCILVGPLRSKQRWHTFDGQPVEIQAYGHSAFDQLMFSASSGTMLAGFSRLPLKTKKKG